VFDRNSKKKPLSERERETLKQLRESLPEYEIHANMRLADVIKADWKQFNYIKGYHLDFVICNRNGYIVAAVELDDSTHDNSKAQERDAKKNIWLSDAGIKLIRIREPQEAIGIRRLIDEYKSTAM
jgi:very-short-patch-repair endonuclease